MIIVGLYQLLMKSALINKLFADNTFTIMETIHKF